MPARLCALAVVLVALFSVLSSVHAATFTVTNTADSGPGSLRAAITGAQASTNAADTIAITVQGTITLTSGELALTNPNAIAGKSVTIMGPGAGSLFVSGGRALSGNTATGSRVFHFSGLTVQMSGLAVILGFVNTGSQSGAGILQEGGTLTLDHCVVEDCLAYFSGAFGSGIANVGGALALTHCVIAGNGGSAFVGGGIGSRNGSLTMTDCTVDYNGGSNFGGIGSVGEPLTLTRCTLSYNGALGNSASYGGGVYSSSGTVALTDCTLTGNTATYAGGGAYLTNGTVTLQGCTFSGNGPNATGQFLFLGGGLYLASATAGVTNCTLTGNNANIGGGIYNLATLTLSDSTIFVNAGGTGYTQGAGLDTESGATAVVTSTILAGNTTYNGESDVTSQGGVTSGGSNLVGDPDGNGFTNGVNHDRTGVKLFGTVMSYALADNGGPTPTLALLPGNPAIDADYSDNTPTDQRGAARPFGARNDIGAFEYGATAATNTPDSFVVTNTNDDGDGSLRRAVNNADADPGARIVFDPTVFGPERQQTIILTSGPIVLRQNMTITGPGANLLAVSGNHASNVLNVPAGACAISGLTVTGGSTNGSGGGVSVGYQANLAMTDCAITGNTAGGQNSEGGGIFVLGTGGNVTLTRCTISNNSAPNGDGGGIAAIATGITLDECTVSGNSATTGGGLYLNADPFAEILSSTISRNTATTGGGLDTNSFVTVMETILAGNTGGPNVSGTAFSLGSNLVGDPDGNGFTNDPSHADPTGSGNHDQTGVTNPGLGPLANNGGPTQTMALLAGSPAIDADFLNAEATDQRGVARPQGVRSDIGAYEFVPPAAVNQPPTLDSLGNVTVAENAGAQTVNLTGIGPGPNQSGETVTVTAASGNTALIPNPAVSYTSPNTTGTLSFTPAANAFGTAGITVTAKNSGGTAGGGQDTTTRTFTVTVTPVLDHFAVALPANVTAGQPVTATLTAQDAGNTTIPVYGGTATLGSSDPLATRPASVTFSGGAATVSVTFGTAGSQSLTATAGSITSSGSTLVAPAAKPTVLHHFPPGLRMIALDETYQNILTAWSVQNEPLDIGFNNQTGLYTLTTTALPLPGHGAWALFGVSGVDVYDTGTPATATVSVPLQQGWNLIGDPFAAPSAVSALSVSRAGTTYNGLAEASRHGLVYTTLYTYPNPLGTSPYLSLGAGDSLQPFTGYWLYAFQSGEALTMTAGK